MHRYNFLLLILSIFLCSGSKCSSTVQSNGPHVSSESSETNTDSVRVVVKGLNYPWEILWGKDNHIWMTERDGKVSKINPTTGKIVFSALIAEVESNNEGGLLGMVHHPDSKP